MRTNSRGTYLGKETDNFFIVGTPICIKNSPKSINEMIEYLKNISDELICCAYPQNDNNKSSKTMGFNSLQDVRCYVRATRVGDIYRDKQCYQSAIYEVQILNKENTSSLK